jgi:hypothetical protein
MVKKVAIPAGVLEKADRLLGQTGSPHLLWNTSAPSADLGAEVVSDTARVCLIARSVPACASGASVRAKGK